MATRQYIGARYVPKFADPIEWNNARSYEALEIVTYLGTSYTSKKNVPVGVAITNTEYWVATGNYNAQVQEYVDLCCGKAHILQLLQQIIDGGHCLLSAAAGLGGAVTDKGSPALDLFH